MKRELWLRLRNYHFNHLVPAHLWDHVSEAFGGADASTKAFASKLARKLGWSNAFSMRAIMEYKKFVYLGNISDFAVTPPKIIDQVWHEHLLFSRAYREFCDSVLGREFDHNPELVPTADQTGTFQAQYLETIELYKQEFNTEPPADIGAVPKFNPATVTKKAATPRKKRDDSRAVDADSTPLYMYFDGSSSSGGHSHGGAADFGGFGGGGGFSGGGGGSSWGDDSGHGDSGGASDAGGGGGDGGGGSGCSSGCGGGCGS